MIDWGPSKMKPLFSQSKLRDFGCGLKFDLRWNKRLGTQQRMAAPPTLGTLVHAVEAAIDEKRDPRKALQGAVQEIASGLFFREDVPLLKQLSSETLSIVLGVPFLNGKNQKQTPEPYPNWLRRQQQKDEWEVLAVERRFYIDVGPLVLASKLDLVIENDLGIFPVERKTRTDISDKAEWIDKFRLDVQILTQVRICQGFYEGEVAGAMVRAVAYSRQNRKNWASDLPQGLSSVKRNDPQWIPRKPATEALFETYLEHVRTEFDRRTKDNCWPAEGFANGMCPRCQFQKICRGELSTSALVPLPPSEIEVESDRRRELPEATTPRGSRKSPLKKKRLQPKRKRAKLTPSKEKRK